MKDKLPISEIFHSVQGEGSRSGRPSVFVRVSGCNLRCWWCDTPYTSWKPEMKPYALDEVRAAVRAFGPCGDVVLTGGEPMLYREQAAALVSSLRADGYFTTVETNGTIHDAAVEPDLWSVSPKLASSLPAIGRGQSGSETADLVARDLHVRNLDNSLLHRFVAQRPAGCQFKFVVTEKDDLVEVEALVANQRIPAQSVWLMPEARTHDEVLAKADWLAGECKFRNYNLALRLHTMMWGQKRGV